MEPLSMATCWMKDPALCELCEEFNCICQGSAWLAASQRRWSYLRSVSSHTCCRAHFHNHLSLCWEVVTNLSSSSENFLWTFFSSSLANHSALFRTGNHCQHAMVHFLCYRVHYPSPAAVNYQPQRSSYTINTNNATLTKSEQGLSAEWTHQKYTEEYRGYFFLTLLLIMINDMVKQV